MLSTTEESKEAASVWALVDELRRLESKVDMLEKEVHHRDTFEESVDVYKKDKFLIASVLE